MVILCPAYSFWSSGETALIDLFVAPAALGIAGYWIGRRIPGVAIVIVIAVALLATGIAFEPLRRSADHELEDDDLGGVVLPITVAWWVLAASLGLAVGGVRAARRRQTGAESP
jgi:hypothetical protein